MNTTKRSAAIDSKEHGLHKEQHINQYGDQGDSELTKRNKKSSVDPTSATITGSDNPVQEQAKEDAASRSSK